MNDDDATIRLHVVLEIPLRPSHITDEEQAVLFQRHRQPDYGVATQWDPPYPARE